ncbi:hypothetical protein [Spongiivirga citrea]|uniref:Uncharacterized protein n=1 Tax=Spongiivirga citrea TaxID=1481457 RepID=A0A6M0CQX5_9FLAO|nr:hypothetical protein [Spongiivirga citrea]NER17917.1 hypothetical protein [Spongiivirga citrea]
MTSKEPSSNAFKKWLDLLQQESWQLELLISGFSIFGLFQLIDPVSKTGALAASEDKMFLIFLIGGVFSAIWICIINLCIHVILRGLWVGALGLRYVSGDIEFDELNYHKWFDRFLRKKIRSFDHFISRLEDYCSIMFAVAFLSIFFVISFFFVLALMFIVGTAIGKNDFPEWIEWTGIGVMWIIGLSMFFTFLDFLTLGFFKRKKWIAVWYYPMYRLYSVISFSFLYRALVYNFLDSKFSRRIFRMLLPVYIILMFLSSIDYQGSRYFNTIDEDNVSMRSAFFATTHNYEDQLLEEDELVRNVSIPSKQIKENAMPLFILFKEEVEDDLVKVFTELELENDIRGIAFEGLVSIGQSADSITKSKLPMYLEKLQEFYKIEIDSVRYKPEFVISKNKKKQLGFETVLDLQSLSRGKHVLRVSRKAIKIVRIPKEKRTDPEVRSKDSIINKNLTAIPFWYYPG